RLEAKHGGRRDLDRLRAALVAGDGGDAAVEQELDRRAARGVAGALAGFVPHLLPDRGDAEQLVDRYELEQRDTAQAARDLDGGQRLQPLRAPILGRHPPGRERPRRRLEDREVAHVAVRERVLQIAFEAVQTARLDV